MVGTGVRSVDHRIPLRNALEAKATAYGDLPHPFVIAVNTLEYIDDIDIMEALFGKEIWTIHFDKVPGDTVKESTMSRVPDGLWTKKSGAANTRVSAVLLFQRFKVWDLENTQLRLYHNPWAKRPYEGALKSLPQAVAQDNKMVKLEGQTLGELLADQ